MLDKDEAVQVHLLSRDLHLADATIIGSHCLGLDYLVNCLKREGIQGKIINVGSTAGFQRRDAARPTSRGCICSTSRPTNTTGRL